MVLAVPGLPHARCADCLTEVQHELFDLGGELCIPGHRAIIDAHVDAARAGARRLQRAAAAAQGLHPAGRRRSRGRAAISRARSRGARNGASGTLARTEAVRPRSRSQYLNRLSDLLFVLARVLARHENGQEVLWRHERDRSSRR